MNFLHASFQTLFSPKIIGSTAAIQCWFGNPVGFKVLNLQTDRTSCVPCFNWRHLDLCLPKILYWRLFSIKYSSRLLYFFAPFCLEYESKIIFSNGSYPTFSFHSMFANCVLTKMIFVQIFDEEFFFTKFK